MPPQPRAERGEDLNFIESEPDFIHKNSILGGDFNCVADTNLDTKTIKRGTGEPRYSNAHSARWEAYTAHFGLCDIYRLHHADKAGGFSRYGSSTSATTATRKDRFYGARHNSPWRWTSIDSSHTLFSGSQSRSDHLPVLQHSRLLEPAKARYMN
jgi:exonuclease III